MKELKTLVRPNIWSLKPYSSARDEYKGVTAEVFLDANENPYNRPINRYPDPLQEKLKAAISPIKGVPAENIFLGNGSDEAIDLVYRVFCNPGKDNVVAIDPTYGMYEVCATSTMWNTERCRSMSISSSVQATCWLLAMMPPRSSFFARRIILRAILCCATKWRPSCSNSVASSW